MARRKRRVNRKKKIYTPQPNIVEYASSTARLIASMVKMAGDNNCVDAAFTAFHDQIEDTLDEHQRNLLKTLFYGCYENLDAIQTEDAAQAKTITTLIKQLQIQRTGRK